jgi:hypothetical protein
MSAIEKGDRPVWVVFSQSQQTNDFRSGNMLYWLDWMDSAKSDHWYTIWPMSKQTY